MSTLNSVHILCQKNRIYTSSKWPCLIMVSQKSSLYLCENSQLRSNLQELLLPLHIWNIIYSISCRRYKSFWYFLCSSGSTNTKYLDCIVLGLGTYFFPVNAVSKQKCAFRCVIRKLLGLKMIKYASCLICIDHYLGAFSRIKSGVSIVDMELDEFILSCMPNWCSKQVYVQGFGCETITFKTF